MFIQEDLASLDLSFYMLPSQEGPEPPQWSRESESDRPLVLPNLVTLQHDLFFLRVEVVVRLAPFVFFLAGPADRGKIPADRIAEGE